MDRTRSVFKVVLALILVVGMIAAGSTFLAGRGTEQAEIQVESVAPV